MGIPSYYSYLIKNFKYIIQKKELFNEQIDNFYLDSNSIIYDILHKTDVDKKNEDEIIKLVCLKIEEYILNVKAKELVFVSFDGIAPVAKLKQQKERRYKSKLTEKILNKPSLFDTAKITPGTNFMINLDYKVINFFKNREKFYGVKKIIVSGSKERGEGEHKIFDYIRNTKNKKHVIYGLDADLIIIGLNNLHHTDNIFLFRETPEFIKSINYSLDANKLYLMNLSNLKNVIIQNMIYKSCDETRVIKDYVLLMMLMGNDFMPHFPSLNIRTFGLQMLLDVYKIDINKKGLYLIDEKGSIIWKNVREIFKFFSSVEHDNLKKEYGIRNKIHKSVVNRCANPEDKMLNIPIIHKSVEEYINPYSVYWENRYYETILRMERNEENLKKICINYLEGLEWNMQYYSFGCSSWTWYYKYSYPPLFCDLIKFTPLWDVELVDEDDVNITNLEQLSYVLPIESLNNIPEKYKIAVEKYKKENEILIDWSFCRYFWESHVDFVDENLNELRYLLKNIE